MRRLRGRTASWACACAAPPVYVEHGVVVQDDCVFYPGYPVCYSSNRHLYIHHDGRSRVTRPAPRRVSVELLFGTPSVKLDFHDSLSIHHAKVAQQHPNTGRHRHRVPTTAWEAGRYKRKRPGRPQVDDGQNIIAGKFTGLFITLRRPMPNERFPCVTSRLPSRRGLNTNSIEVGTVVSQARLQPTGAVKLSGVQFHMPW